MKQQIKSKDGQRRDFLHFDRVVRLLESGGSAGERTFLCACIRAGSCPVLVRRFLKEQFGMSPSRFMGLFP